MYQPPALPPKPFVGPNKTGADDQTVQQNNTGSAEQSHKNKDHGDTIDNSKEDENLLPPLPEVITSLAQSQLVTFLNSDNLLRGYLINLNFFVNFKNEKRELIANLINNLNSILMKFNDLNQLKYEMNNKLINLKNKEKNFNNLLQIKLFNSLKRFQFNYKDNNLLNNKLLLKKDYYNNISNSLLNKFLNDNVNIHGSDINSNSNPNSDNNTDHTNENPVDQLKLIHINENSLDYNDSNQTPISDNKYYNDSTIQDFIKLYKSSRKSYYLNNERLKRLHENRIGGML
ncbi:uncharacterized protein ASCRUDRAFT_79109 [Ascoidea rubescens DSM 1968]|uniref:VPS37 C-terminal domain-containing protein n=1 Tax=Ascoidea rubescens DSM 1968 TaxID=1344418 RepID=A0A1D2VRM3_9ASCO|nr:hypothetical protein ASCRUDRAFT_79109 [Ascoidea rubescens DSM 1968]ODV64215.1 hypothetical protein ASCRUDRAFT_79109 [Ascoidea rubescens DSM 1968]